MRWPLTVAISGFVLFFTFFSEAGDADLFRTEINRNVSDKALRYAALRLVEATYASSAKRDYSTIQCRIVLLEGEIRFISDAYGSEKLPKVVNDLLSEAKAALVPLHPAPTTSLDPPGKRLAQAEKNSSPPHFTD